MTDSPAMTQLHEQLSRAQKAWRIAQTAVEEHQKQLTYALSARDAAEQEVKRREVGINVQHAIEELAAARWIEVDHKKSDKEWHLYCRECYDRIPGFLVNQAFPFTLPPESGNGKGK